jgi:hypothetical protein
LERSDLESEQNASKIHDGHCGIELQTTCGIHLVIGCFVLNAAVYLRTVGSCCHSGKFVLVIASLVSSQVQTCSVKTTFLPVMKGPKFRYCTALHCFAGLFLRGIFDLRCTARSRLQRDDFSAIPRIHCVY